MLKKIFKTIFIMSLCVGISLPTNAAVSVSDGSAFVTKAEFAADLNNLSNRMAQLENSLDAKIDSLVSSYLTRNGIWNGATQMAASSEIEIDVTSLSKVNFDNSKEWQFKSAKLLYFEANKTGMFYYNFDLILNGRIDSSRQLPMKNVFYRYVATGGTEYDNDAAIDYVWYKEQNGSQTIMSRYVISQSWATNAKTRTVFCKDSTSSGIFFVSKGDVINLAFRLCVLSAYQKMNYSDEMYNPLKAKVLVNEFSIY